MKKPIPFHPICFALFPILYLYSRNLALFPWSDLIRPSLIAILGVAAIFGLAWLLVRNVHRAAAVASLAAIEFFTFDLAYIGVRSFLPHWIFPDVGVFLNAWIFVSLGLLVVAGWKWRWNGAGTTGFMNVAGAVLVILPTCTILFGLYRIHSQLASLEVPAAVTGKATNGASQPDIYYIILDGYGREDAIQKYFGFSNHPFISALRQRGFYVADQSRSNYCQTELSLASSLNEDFISNLVKVYSPDTNIARAPLDKLLDGSKVAADLKSRGYEYVAITSGFPGVRPSSSDILISGPPTYSLFESSLLNATPFQAPTGVDSMYDARRVHLVAALDNLLHMEPRGPRPRFVFAHVLAPHPPFVITADGKSTRPKSMPFGYWDASAFFDVGGTHKMYHDGYLGQLQYVNGRILGIVDKLMKETPRPIIIIQGDHGSRQYLDQVSVAKSDVREAFRNLNAYLVPDAMRAQLYPGITPVNSFRVLFDSLYGEKLPLLPDTSYFTAWATPYVAIDVTKKVLLPLDGKRLTATRFDRNTRSHTTAEFSWR